MFKHFLLVAIISYLSLQGLVQGNKKGSFYKDLNYFKISILNCRPEKLDFKGQSREEKKQPWDVCGNSKTD